MRRGYAEESDVKRLWMFAEAMGDGDLTLHRACGCACTHTHTHTHEPAIVEHHDPVRVDEGVEAMGHGQDCPVGKVGPHRPLNQRIRLRVHVGRRLVEHQDSVYLCVCAGR